MAISAVNSVSFKGKAVTDKGNEYNTCNVGKYAGTGIGAAATVYGGVQVKKGFTILDQLGDLVKSAIGELAVEINPEETKEGVVEALESINFPKSVKKYGLIASAIIGSLMILGGLGLGTLVDGGINLFRAHKADKKSDTNNKTDVQE